MQPLRVSRKTRRKKTLEHLHKVFAAALLRHNAPGRARDLVRFRFGCFNFFNCFSPLERSKIIIKQMEKLKNTAKTSKKTPNKTSKKRKKCKIGFPYYFPNLHFLYYHYYSYPRAAFRGLLARQSMEQAT